MSDGFLEIDNGKGEEFGWDRLEQLVVRNALEPLSRIVELLAEETARFGNRQDDQTILLVRGRRMNEHRELLTLSGNEAI